jgi:hypothetical protein
MQLSVTPLNVGFCFRAKLVKNLQSQYARLLATKPAVLQQFRNFLKSDEEYGGAYGPDDVGWLEVYLDAVDSVINGDDITAIGMHSLASSAWIRVQQKATARHWQLADVSLECDRVIENAETHGQFFDYYLECHYLPGVEAAFPPGQ